MELVLLLCITSLRCVPEDYVSPLKQNSAKTTWPIRDPAILTANDVILDSMSRWALSFFGTNHYNVFVILS